MFKNLINIQRIKGDFRFFAYSPYNAKQYVYDHRNIFNDKTLRFIELNYPVVIKEINYFKNEKQYWYWVFYDDELVIYQFSKKLTKQEYQYMMKEILEEHDSKKVYSYYKS